MSALSTPHTQGMDRSAVFIAHLVAAALQRFQTRPSATALRCAAAACAGKRMRVQEVASLADSA